MVPLLLAIFSGMPSNAEEAAKKEAPAQRIGIIFEGTFEDHEVSQPISGAEATVMVPYYEWDYGVRPFTEERWTKQGMTWDQTLSIAKKLGDSLIDSLEPLIVRDDRGVVSYAIFGGDSPFISSAVLSDKFLPLFEETMGKSLYVMFIDRHIMYVFPSRGSTLEEFGPALVREFKHTKLPVSLEIFLLNQEGFKAIGELSRDEATP